MLIIYLSIKFYGQPLYVVWHYGAYTIVWFFSWSIWGVET